MTEEKNVAPEEAPRDGKKYRTGYSFRRNSPLHCEGHKGITVSDCEESDETLGLPQDNPHHRKQNSRFHIHHGSDSCTLAVYDEFHLR